MSLKLMAAAWELDIPSTEKMVLLCLCDHANDDGRCWPSMARLARKCSVTDRTVQRTIGALRKRGILSTVGEAGKTLQFYINPRHSVTPDTVSPPTLTPEPPTLTTQTPDTVSPEPIREPSQEPSKNIGRAKAERIARPNSVPAQVWKDFLQQRKKPITQTALTGIEREAAKAGWTLEAAITEAAERGWQSFKADWIRDKANGNGFQNSNGGGADKRSGLARAIDGELEQIRALRQLL